MTRTFAALTVAALGFAATAAAAAPVSFYQPNLTKTAQGAQVRGAVCRTAATPATAPVRISLQHLGSNGQVLDEVTKQLPGSLNAANRSCDFYSVKTNWIVGAGDTVRARPAS